MNTIVCANTNTNTKREWKRKACVIDLSKYKKEESRNLFRKRKIFLFSLVAFTILASSTLIANAQNTKMQASVAGWYKVNQASNEKLEITTNMMVYVNGTLYNKQNSITAKE